MQTSDVASVLPESLRERLSKRAAVRSYARNAVIVTEADENASLYVLLAGRARVFVADENGREMHLGDLGPGEYFGEVTLDGGPRSASVTAIEPCRCAILRRADFAQFIQEDPQLAMHVIGKLARLVRLLTENVRGLALMDVYGRVARVLLDLADEVDGRQVIRGRITQKDIAARVGASREMVSRICTELAKAGYIRKEKDGLVLLRKLPAKW